MLPPIQVFERAHRVAPLGVRFRDPVTGAIIHQGLRLWAWPVLDPSRRTQAGVNSSGAFYFNDLPGLRNAEFGAGDDPYWATIVTRQFVVEVQDWQGRFQPFSLDVDLPHKGILDWALGSPLGSPVTAHSPRPVPLFSTAARSIPSGNMVIRAELFDPVARAPAPFAVVDAIIAGEAPARGVADERGRIAIVLPLPKPIDFANGGGSPPDGPPLTSQVWTVQLNAFFSRPDPVPAYPNLRVTLSQPAATLWANEGRTQPLGTQSLSFGRDLIVRTRRDADATLLSQLFITPGH